MRTAALAPIAALALLAACSRGEQATGAVSADEARQLNEAAAMLDERSVDANVLDAGDNREDGQESAR